MRFNIQSPACIQTTSFLTATTLIYATGIGITAAAGTQFALQLVLIDCFKINSF